MSRKVLKVKQHLGNDNLWIWRLELMLFGPIATSTTKESVDQLPGSFHWWRRILGQTYRHPKEEVTSDGAIRWNGRTHQQLFHWWRVQIGQTYRRPKSEALVDGFVSLMEEPEEEDSMGYRWKTSKEWTDGTANHYKRKGARGVHIEAVSVRQHWSETRGRARGGHH